MEKNELIQLETVVKKIPTPNRLSVKEETAQTEVFCAVKSAGRKEYYEALRAGKKVSRIFVVDLDDFEMAARFADGKKKMPSRVVYDGVKYLIRREYMREGSAELELTCEEVE